MRRTILVLAAVMFSTGVAFAQTGTTSSGGTTGSSTSTDATKPPVKPKKKGREWGRFSSQRVGTSLNQPPPPKVGASPRLE